MRINQKGTTLIELMISVGITSAVLAGLLTVVSLHMNTAGRSTNRAGLSVDMMMLSNYFAREIPSAGGELLPVWTSVGVENNCAARTVFPNCGGSDRLTVVRAVGNRTCSIRALPSAGVIESDISGGVCCFQGMNLLNSHVSLVKVTIVGQRYVTAVNLGTCRITVANGPASFNDSAVEPFNWVEGTVVPVDVKTFYLDRTTNELNRYTYRNGGANVNDGTLSPMVDQVLDFQLGLGFDFSPADGQVSDTTNATDEFMYNAPGVNERLGVGFFLNASSSQLRMVALGLIIGTPSMEGNSGGGFRILDGPELEARGWLLERQVSKFMIRSTRIYE